MKKSNNLIILLAGFLIIGLVGAYYFLQQKANGGEALSDKIADIEKDLKAMKFDDLETEIGNIQKELQQ